MTPAQAGLVRDSLARVDPAHFAGEMLNRMLALDRTVLAILGDEPLVRVRHMWETMVVVSADLPDLEAARPWLQAIGARHGRGGVGGHHFRVMRKALMDALAEQLDAGFTPALRGAWSLAFDTVADAMASGAASERPAASEGGPRAARTRGLAW